MAPSGHADYAFPHAAHHKVMAQAIESVLFGKRKRVMILCPPGAAKSTLVKQGAMLFWANNPESHVLRVSATTSLSERFARQCRSALMEPHYRRLTGLTIDPLQQSVGSFANSRGGTMTSAGMGSSIVGLRADLAVIDDPVPSWEAAHSESQREAQIDWYWSEYRSRQKPDCGEILVMTRWHYLDLAGHILQTEPEEWDIIRIPLLCDDPANDPLGREMDELLWPEWYTQKMVKEAQRDPEIWSGLWQESPMRSEGDFLNPDDLPIVDQIPDGLGIYASLDLALTEKQSADATVIIVAGMAPDGTLYILDMVSSRCSPEQTIENLQELHEKYQFREVLIEDSPAEKVFRDLCHKIFRQQHRALPLVPMPTRGRDKMARAQPVRGLAKMGAVKLKRGVWNANLLREVTEFPYCRHDDVVDALALLGRRAAKMGPSTHDTYEQGEIKYSLQLVDGKLRTTATLGELFEDHDDSSQTWRGEIVRI
ncbi:phage terminase large subunit [Pseudomonadota bacterium]